MVTKDNKPVPVKLIASFGRMKRFRDHAAIVAALRESSVLDIAGDEGDETVVRKNAYVIAEKGAEPKELIKKVADKTLKFSMYAVRIPPPCKLA